MLSYLLLLVSRNNNNNNKLPLCNIWYNSWVGNRTLNIWSRKIRFEGDNAMKIESRNGLNYKMNRPKLKFNFTTLPPTQKQQKVIKSYFWPAHAFLLLLEQKELSGETLIKMTSDRNIHTRKYQRP